MVRTRDYTDGLDNISQQEYVNREYQLSYYGWLTELPDPDPILTSQGIDISSYRNLLIDSHLSAVITKRKSGVTSMEWEIEQKNASDIVLKFIQDYFDGLPNLNNICKKLLDCIYYGYQPFVLHWEIKGGYRLPRIEDRPPEYFFFDNKNQLRIRTKNLTGILADPMLFLVATQEADYLNPYGDRVAKKVFWPVIFKKGGMKFWLKMTEKYGMPQAIGKVPKTAKKDQRTALARSLNNMVQDGVIVLNDDESVNLLDAGSRVGSADLYKGLLNFCNYEISKAVLTVVNTVEVGEHGSYAAADTQYTGEGKLNIADTEIITSFFNKLIRLIVDVNFGADIPAPQFSQYEQDNVDKTLAERDAILVTQGVKFSKDYYIQNYNLKDNDFDIAITPPSQTPPTQFKEADSKPIDKILNSIPDKLLQLQMAKILKPVIDLVNGSGTFAEMNDKLADMFPEMTTDKLEDILAKAMFIASIEGRDNNG